MTPRSLMGLFAAFALALPVSVSAAWLQISAAPQPAYFITQENFKALDIKGETRVLYVAPSSLPNKRSKYSLEKQADGTYAIVEFTGKGKSKTKTVVQKGATSKPVAPKTDKAVNTTPAVDPVAAFVEKSAAIPADKKALAKQVLEKLKAGQPEEYKKLAAGGQATVDKLLAAILALPAATAGDAAKTYDALILKDANGASPLSASLGGAAVKKPGQVDNVEGTPVGDVAANDPKNVNRNLINVLTGLLDKNKEAAATDVGERLFKYMTGKEGGDYIDKKLRADADGLTRMKATTKAWVLKVKPAQVSNLYYMLGSDGPAPAWVTDTAVAAALALTTTQRRPIFYEDMKPWTGAKVVGQADRKPMAKGSDAEVAAFLTDSAEHATSVLAQTRLAKEISESITSNDPGLIVPGGVGGGAKIVDPTKSFDFNALYGQAGGEQQDVYAKGDKVSRQISIRLYTSRDPVTGALVNKLGVFDTTYQGDIFGQRFPLAQGESKFPLDDRTKGFPNYELKMTPGADGDTMITFKREGGADKGDGTITTSLNTLYKKRAQQAVESGNTLSVNGKSYYVLGQGGAKGAVMMFPSDTPSRLDAKENVPPELYSEIGERREGRDVNLPGKRSLGNVDGKDYHLAFNDKLKYWEVADGKGDDYLPKPPPKTDGTTNTGNNGTTNDGTTTDPQTGGTTGDVDTVAIEKGLTEKGEYERNTAVRDGLSEEYKESVRVYDWKRTDSFMNVANRHPMIVPASVRPARSVYAAFLGGDKADMTPRKGEVRGIGKWLATTSTKITAYFDLSKPTPKPVDDNPNDDKVPSDTVYDFDSRCWVAEDTKVICFKDVVLIKDAMGRGGFSSQEMEVAKTNAAKAMGEAKGYVEGKTPYQISGSKATNLVMAIGTAGSWSIWPKFEAGPAGDGSHADTKPGPSNSFDGKMPVGDELELPTNEQDAKLDNVNLKLYHIKTEGGAALYADAAKGEEAKIKTWWMLFKLKTSDDKVKRTGFIKVLDADKELTVSGIHINGVDGRKKPAGDIVSNGAPRLRRTPGKGVIYVVENKAIDVPDDSKTTNSPNCVGPVLWWGVKDEAEALKVCQNNGF